MLHISDSQKCMLKLKSFGLVWNFLHMAEDKNQHVTIRVKIMTILLLIILTMLNIKFSSCRLHSRIFSLPSE